MGIRRSACAAVAAFIVWGAGPALSSVQSEAKDFEQRITAELRVENPQAADLFARANAARDKEDHRQALALYAQVRELAPRFDHAVRRQAMEELALGDRVKAIALAREAMAMRETAENMVALSAALVEGPAASSDADKQEALQLAQRATQLDPRAFHAHLTLAVAALENQDLITLEKAVERLEVLGPQEIMTPYFRGLLEASRGNFSEAETALSKSRQLGLPEEQYRAISDAVRQARPWPQRVLPVLGWIVGGWAAGLLLLLATGTLLSQATMRAAGRVPAQPSGEAQGSDSFLRRLYRIVLWLSCAYYWVSLPLVVLAVLAAGGGMVYLFLWIGRIPIKLLVIVVILVFVTLASIVKSLFVRGGKEDPGLRLPLASEPRLRDLLREVAGRIGTRPVDNVYLTPGTDLAVMERGGMLRQLRGKAERCLILGVGVLDGLKLGPFKAILAHEYGHFSNQDTAGGGFALAVRRSMLTMAGHLAAGGAAAWYNPAWLFFNGFYRVFLRISQGASRLQEVLADRWAAFTYGAAAFEQGLRHVIERSVFFDAHANVALNTAVNNRVPVANLYRFDPAALDGQADLTYAVEQALKREPSPYDSHPSPEDRFRWVRAVAGSASAAFADDKTDVWSLFRDRDKIEQTLTRTVCDNLRSQGVEFAPAATA